MTPPSDRVEELSVASRHTAAKLETIGATVSQLRARLDALEEHLEAAQATHVRTTERIETVRTELGRIGRIEASVGHARDELASQIQAREQSLRQELLEARLQAAKEAERIGREIPPLVARLDALPGIVNRLDASERERNDLMREVQSLSAQIEEVAAERAGIEEVMRRAETRLAARIEGFSAELAGLREELVSWRGRIEGQSEAVREARAVADEMRAEVGRIQQVTQVAAEAQRVAEARVATHLEDMREESAAEWQRFRQQRAADWAQLARENSARDDQGRELVRGLESAVERITQLETGLLDTQAEAVVRAEDLREIRRSLVGLLTRLRDTTSDSTDVFQQGLTRDEQDGVLEARRQAARRALRARRDARAG
jgi:DNA repair exonuclease SbcCD ATPase subunit